MKNCKLKLIAAAVMMSLGTAGSVYASDTSSSIRGKITGPNGQVAANVKIKVVHQPTGTVSEFITNDTGTFVAKGLRVGGPYIITIDSDTYRDSTMKDVYLKLGDTFRLNKQLENDNVERISVSATPMAEATASNSTFGEDIVDNMPSLNRDLKDIARLNPLATFSGNNNLTFAGANPRMNSITVDGIGQNDDFGLRYEGYPTEQPPISLESISEISVSVVPFSVRKGGFTGGNINAVTKSGDNEFHGSVYYEFTDQDLAGDSPFINTLNELEADGHRTYEETMSKQPQSVKTLGLTLGGPIIKDQLFFFANYETWSRELEFDTGFQDSGAGSTYEITQAQYDQFTQVLSSVYGMSDALYTGNPENTDDKLLLKLDWDVMDGQRMAFTYQYQDNNDLRNYSPGGNTLPLASSIFNYQTKLNNFAWKLYSDWSSNFTTQFGITFKDVKANAQTPSDLGSVTVSMANGQGPAIQFGTPSFYHANEAKNENLKVTFDANYLFGEHDISFGFEVERLNLYNMYAPNAKGSWSFDSLEDFANGVVGRFSYANAYTNDAQDVAYDNTRYTTVLYGEDTFYLTDELEVTAGLRYELVSADDKPTLNPNFVDTYGYSNQFNLDGLDMFMPRVSFKWFASDDLTVRGGVGRFNGGIPNVWYNGSFTNDGITYVSAPSSAINAYYAEHTADITQVPTEIQNSLVQGAGSTSHVDPNFVLPSDWRVQVAADLTFDIPMLGDDFAWTTELTYMKKKDEPVWYDLSRTPLDENGSVNYAADGERIIMGSIYEGTGLEDNFDIMLSNSDLEGRSIIFTTALSKNWDNGLSMSASYAHQDVTEVTGGTSSRNQSNYHNTIMVNRNEPMLGRGYYEIEHSFKLNLGYKHEFFEGYATKINMFFERRSGRPLSWLMGFFRDGDLGDQRDFNTYSPYLPYIPSGPNDPNVDWDWANAVSWEEISSILDRAGIEACGCIIERGYATQPWVTELDLSIKQELPGFMDGHKGELTFSISNLANLLNDEWGRERRAQYPKAIYDFAGLSDDGKYQIERSYRGYDVRNHAGYESSASAWQIKIGVRYSF